MRFSTHPKPLARAFFTGVVALALTVGACGGDDSSDSDGSPDTRGSGETNGSGGIGAGGDVGQAGSSASSGTEHHCGKARVTTLFSCFGANLQCGYYGEPTLCCPPNRPYSCPTTQECFEDAYSADSFCRTNKHLPCIECVPTSSTPGLDGGPADGGDPCLPCANFVQSMGKACAPPNELSFNCYCTTAKMHKCVLVTPDCSTDKAESQAEVNRMVAAANDTGGGTCTP